jgi:DNA-binding transcriptional LysR family regulator
MPEVVRRKADFGDLRLFWAVAEAGSFGAAARALGMSTSTLTRGVDNLEARLGVKLLTRTAQGITLTEAGQTAYDRVLTMERAAAALEMELAGFDKSPRGMVKLSAPDGIGGVFLTPFIPDFLRAHPQIDLAIDCGLWPDRPLKGEIDVALTFSKPDQDEVIARPLAYLHYDMFAARSYLDLYGRPRTLQEAMGHPYVHHTAQVYQLTDRASAFQMMIHARLQTNSSAVSFNAIREGVGIGPLPTAIFCFDPSLVMLDVMRHGPVTLWLAYRRELARSTRVRQVVAWLEEVFDPKAQPWYREDYVSPAEFAPELERHLARRQGAAPENEVTPLKAPRRA